MNLTEEEQVWVEKQAKLLSRMISKDDLLNEFSENAESKLIRSGLFNNIFMSLMQGANRYEIIETLVGTVEEQNKSIEELLKYSTKPIYRTEE